MFDDIIKKKKKFGIFLYDSHINPIIYPSGLKIWGQKTLNKYKPEYEIWNAPAGFNRKLEPKRIVKEKNNECKI